jgi:hypothetical protein
VEIGPIHGILLPRARECLLEPSFDRLELWIGACGRASRIGSSLRHGEWAILR